MRNSSEVGAEASEVSILSKCDASAMQWRGGSLDVLYLPLLQVAFIDKVRTGYQLLMDARSRADPFSFHHHPQHCREQSWTLCIRNGPDKHEWDGLPP